MQSKRKIRIVLKNRARTAFVLATLIGLLSYLTLILYSTNPLLGFIAVFLLPFLTSFILTRNLICSLVLTWVNEIFVGGKGDWISVGPLSGRWILLLAVLITWFSIEIIKLAVMKRRRFTIEHKFSIWVFIWGLLLPCWLVFYSTIIKNTPLFMALSDVDFLFVLLIYYPMRSLVSDHWDIVLGWILGSSFVLIVLLLGMAMGPFEFRALAVDTLISKGRSVGVTISGVSRIGLVHVVLLFFPIFLAFFIAIDGVFSSTTRIKWAFIGLLGISPFAVTYLRGPIFASILTILLIVTAMLFKQYYWNDVLRIIFFLPMLIISMIVVMLLVVPEEAIQKFAISSSSGLQEWFSTKRVEQADFAIEAFLESPLLGKGIGVPLNKASAFADYFNSLDMELEYFKLLYRFGFMAFALYMIPILWFFTEPIRVLRIRVLKRYPNQGKTILAILATIIAIFISGSLNPYLTTPFTSLFVILYLSIKRVIINESNVIAV